MTSFDFNAWSEKLALKEATVEALKKEDLDNEDSLKLLTAKDIEDLGLTVGQRGVLGVAVTRLQQGKQAPPEDMPPAHPLRPKP